MSRRADRIRLRRLFTIAAVLLAAMPAVAGAQKARSKQEEQRRKLTEGLGLKKSDAPPPSPPAAVPEAEPAEEQAGGKPEARTAAPAASAGPSFRRAIHPLLMQACKSCHAQGAPAAATALLLTGDAAIDHAAVRRVLDLRAPAASAILAKASGQKLHAGGAPWPVGGPAYSRVLAWIQVGHASTAAAVRRLRQSPGGR